ncbi:MAG: GerAB/ArcD/ProY family transporter, partial [Ferruginibacter sp.]
MYDKCQNNCKLFAGFTIFLFFFSIIFMAYNQFRAMMAITRGSLRAILRSPSAIVFSFIFPFLFILVFGFIGNSSMQSYRIVLAPGSDTANALFSELKNSDAIKFVNYATERELNEAVVKGRIAGTISIKKSGNAVAPFMVTLNSSTSSNDKWPQLKNFIASTINHISNSMYQN